MTQFDGIEGYPEDIFIIQLIDNFGYYNPFDISLLVCLNSLHPPYEIIDMHTY